MVPKIMELSGKDEGWMVCLVTGVFNVIKFTKHLCERCVQWCQKLHNRYVIVMGLGKRVWLVREILELVSFWWGEWGAVSMSTTKPDDNRPFQKPLPNVGFNLVYDNVNPILVH